MGKHLDRLQGGLVAPPMPKVGKQLTGTSPVEVSEREQNNTVTTQINKHPKGEHNEKGNR